MNAANHWKDKDDFHCCVLPYSTVLELCPVIFYCLWFFVLSYSTVVDFVSCLILLSLFLCPVLFYCLCFCVLFFLLSLFLYPVLFCCLCFCVLSYSTVVDFVSCLILPSFILCPVLFYCRWFCVLSVLLYLIWYIILF